MKCLYRYYVRILEPLESKVGIFRKNRRTIIFRVQVPKMYPNSITTAKVPLEMYYDNFLV